MKNVLKNSKGIKKVHEEHNPKDRKGKTLYLLRVTHLHP